MGVSNGPHLVRRKARRRHTQGWRARSRAALDAGADGQALAGLLAHERGLPDPNNRVTLDRDGKIVLSYKPSNEEGHRRLTEKLKSLMKQQTKCAVHGHECHEGLFARNLYAGQRIPLAGVAHQNGTICFGADPRTSALDMNCRAHEVDNLYVVDASFFVSSGAVNPALTIVANALRVGDHLLDRLGARTAESANLPRANRTLKQPIVPELTAIA